MKDEIKEKIKAYYVANDIDEIFNYITNLQEENERLKNGYCELKVKCNNGECDCTNEEYEDMAQANMRGSLLLEDYKSRCEKASKLIRFIAFNSERPLTITELNKVYNILQGVGKDE